MPKQRGLKIAVVIGSLAVLVPILASIYLAWKESVSAEKALSLTYAHDALRRLEKTANQFANGLQMANKSGFPVCSPEDIQQLRGIALGSSYIKAAGRVSEDTLLCTSQGSNKPVSLGIPSLISIRGVREYYRRNLSADQWHPLDVFSSQGFAIIVDPNLPLDISTEGPDIELVAYAPSAPDREPLASVGQNIQRSWLKSSPEHLETTTFENGYLVTRIRSARWDLGVVVATPVHYIFRRVTYFALFLIPIGIACGVILGWTVRYIVRFRSSFPALIRSACKEGDFYVEYQPMVDLVSGSVYGAEALVRWKSLSAEMGPDHFIPLAEKHGLIHLITRQVLSVVAVDLPRILKLDSKFRVSINMSAADLRTDSVIGQLDQLLRKSGASPENIEIEATERAFLQGPETIDLLLELREKGFQVAIDDFGTGYSSLSCLQSLPLDTLKIDKTFVENIGTDGPTSQVILHIIEMGRSLSLQLIGEGVETKAQAQYLANHGVRYAQGWLFGRPLAIDELLKELEARKTDKPAIFV